MNVKYSKTPIPRGIQDPAKLQAFFGDKGHRNLVLRVADLLEIPERNLEFVRDLCVRLNIGGCRKIYRNTRDLIKYCSPLGYLIIPLGLLCSTASMKDLHALQVAVEIYKDIRRSKNYPVKVEKCRCNGRNQQCRECEGSGRVIVLVEMDDREKELAEMEMTVATKQT